MSLLRVSSLALCSRQSSPFPSFSNSMSQKGLLRRTQSLRRSLTSTLTRWEVPLSALKVAPGGPILVPMALSLLLLEKAMKETVRLGEHPTRLFQTPTQVAEMPGALPTKLAMVRLLALVIAGAQRMPRFQAGSCTRSSSTRLPLKSIRKDGDCVVAYGFRG